MREDYLFVKQDPHGFGCRTFSRRSGKNLNIGELTPIPFKWPILGQEVRMILELSKFS